MIIIAAVSKILNNLVNSELFKRYGPNGAPAASNHEKTRNPVSSMMCEIADAIAMRFQYTLSLMRNILNHVRRWYTPNTNSGASRKDAALNIALFDNGLGFDFDQHV